VLVAGYHTVVGSLRVPRARDSCRVATVNVLDGARGGSGDALGFADALGVATAVGVAEATTSHEDGPAAGSACHCAGACVPHAASAKATVRVTDAARAAYARRGERTGRL
jgi:hypothetical protein